MTDTPSTAADDLVKRLEERHETARVQGGDMMTYGEGDPLALAAAAHKAALEAEARYAKLLEAAHWCAWRWRDAIEADEEGMRTLDRVEDQEDFIKLEQALAAFPQPEEQP